MASNHSRPDLAGTAAAPASRAPERAILFLDFARVSERVPLVSVLSSDTAEEFSGFQPASPEPGLEAPRLLARFLARGV